MTEKRVMVRYRVKPEHVAENEELVRAVYEELHRLQPDGLRYGTFRLEDGVSFMHFAVETGDGPSPLAGLPAFRRFRAGVRERCDEPPVSAGLEEIGSYRLLDT
ncbi:MAG: hypothetical protein JWN32_2224 [Solirubrobacterales bacterium]|nr:hypothetical protein [Solirubrobacterales bacterium]